MRRGIVVAGMLLAMGLAGTAEAQDRYQSDVSFELLSVENTTGPMDVSLKTIGYRWYFAQVDGMEGPIELQPFRQRASWAEIGIGFGEEELGGTDVGGLNIGARYVIPNSPVGVDVSYESVEQNDADFYDYLRLGAVVWLNDDSNLAIEAGFTFGEVTFVPSDFTSLDVGARYVMPIGDMALEIAGRYRTIDPDAAGAPDNSGIEIETRYFFMDELFAGLSFSTVDADGQPDTSNWAISAGYSLPCGLDVGLRFGEGAAPWNAFPSGDDDVFALEVGFRF